MSEETNYALLDHARRYLWANPYVDSQAIFKLNRLSRINGVNRRLVIAGSEIILPSANEYLVYSLSGLDERWIGITQGLKPRQWFHIAEVMNGCNALFQLYNTRGIMVPMAEVFLYKQLNGHLVLAIKRDNKLPNFDDGLYFRTYSNAVIVDRNGNGGKHIGQLLSVKVKDLNDLSLIANKRAEWESKSPIEQTFLYVNGILRRKLATVDIAIGDYVDLIWDDTVKAIKVGVIDPLSTYESIKDQCVKYIISRGKTGGKVDYFDDIDFFVYDKVGDVGIYYHRNTARNVGQLTHGDYGLPASTLHAFIDHDENPLRFKDCEILMYTRDTIGDPQLCNVHCRLSTLYRLPEKEIRKELSSPIGQMREWQAPNIEQDAYMRVLSSPSRDLKLGEVVNAYGFHGVVEAIGNNFVRPSTTSLLIPPLYKEGGLAITHFTNRVVREPILKGMDYLTWNTEKPKLVYFIAGSVFSSEQSRTYPARYTDTRFGTWYYLDKSVDKVKQEWLPVDNDDWITFSEGRWNIFVDQSRYELCYRYGDEVLSCQLTQKVENPYLEFQLPSHFWLWRHVDVYLGNRKLIPELEFRFNQNVVQYLGGGLTLGQNVTLTVVAYGLLPEGKRTNMDYEVGFVTNNCVSYGNGRYLLTDRNPLVNVGGNLRLKNEVNWHEQNMGASIANALPYSIECKYPNLVALDERLTIPLLERSLEMDERLKNYMDLKYPLPLENELNIAVEPLVVVSSFLAWIITHRKSLLFGVSEWVPMSQLRVKLDDAFKHFADDICLSKFDSRYLRIVPHGFGGNIEVTAKEYDFIDKANIFYLKGKVPINEHLTIGN